MVAFSSSLLCNTGLSTDVEVGEHRQDQLIVKMSVIDNPSVVQKLMTVDAGNQISTGGTTSHQDIPYLSYKFQQGKT
jgi:hypothetical protein